MQINVHDCQSTNCHPQALGNLYFVHHSIDDCQIWNFHTNSFVVVDGHDIQAGNIENVPIKEKDKFPKEFFPEVTVHVHVLVLIKQLIAVQVVKERVHEDKVEPLRDNI